MAQAHAAQGSDKYYVPHGSKWPAIGAVALFITMLGTASVLNGASFGPWIAYLGLAAVAYMFFGWFGTVINESEGGLYNAGVDRSFRMGMSWFIFSEVMFFAAFFGALFYARQLSVPWLGGEGARFTHQPVPLAGLRVVAGRPTARPPSAAQFETIPAFGLPAINTAILLTSGVTITIAHHALKAGNRGILKIFLALTFLLGFLFVGLQAEEYIHAYHELNLTLGSGIYGSTFFMLTGFHGLHVTLGAIMLLVIWLRVMKGHFTPHAPLRLRGRGLVLALRRRGVARAVHLRVLAVAGTRHRRRAAGRNLNCPAGRPPRAAARCSAADAVRLDHAALPGDEQQHEQQHGQRDAHRQRVDHALRLALVLDQVKQPRAEARDDGGQGQDDEELDHAGHGSLRVGGKYK